MRTYEITHVFHHADDIYLHLAKHFDGLAGVLQSNVRPVDIGVEEPDFVSHFGQDDREVDGESGLADSAFAGAHRDNGVHARKRLRTRRLLTGVMRMSAQWLPLSGPRYGPAYSII